MKKVRRQAGGLFYFIYFCRMLNANQTITKHIQLALKSLYDLNNEKIILQKTRKEFEGDYTLTTFNLAKNTGKKPDELADEIGKYLKNNTREVENYEVVKGFLNIRLSDSFWLSFLKECISSNYQGLKEPNSSGKVILLEYSSPNTNKPLHLGHIRNNLLGYSVAEILKAVGHQVIKTNLVNDRGIHICKSMLAWQRFGNGETPQSAGIKGDHLVGKYYVEFDKAYKMQIKELIEKGIEKEEAEKTAPLMLEAQEMLRKWEKGDEQIIALWKKMNEWVYEGFAETYKTLGVDFDKIYYESETYLYGKEVIKEGLDKKVFYKKEDGSIRIDLTAEGLDEKVVLRADGTSVYITQDIGTAIIRFKDYPNITQAIYTVGNEQDYHFKTLFKILEKLGYHWAKECYHLSYGMVELPEGKMKSREGTVVDADDLLKEMFETAKKTTDELGKVDEFSREELEKLYKTIGLGALKYFILKVDPKKKMLFNPKESIDFNGHTGPFIQYTHARIKSVLRKAETENNPVDATIQLNRSERELIKYIYEFEASVEESANNYNPAIIANFIYELAKEFNRFYHDYSILKEENAAIKKMRLELIKKCAEIIKNGMLLLGISVPEKM